VFLKTFFFQGGTLTKPKFCCFLLSFLELLFDLRNILLLNTYYYLE